MKLKHKNVTVSTKIVVMDEQRKAQLTGYYLSKQQVSLYSPEGGKMTCFTCPYKQVFTVRSGQQQNVLILTQLVFQPIILRTKFVRVF
jgi:hypothetical protein